MNGRRIAHEVDVKLQPKSCYHYSKVHRRLLKTNKKQDFSQNFLNSVVNPTRLVYNHRHRLPSHRVLAGPLLRCVDIFFPVSLVDLRDLGYKGVICGRSGERIESTTTLTRIGVSEQ